MFQIRMISCGSRRITSLIAANGCMPILRKSGQPLLSHLVRLTPNMHAQYSNSSSESGDEVRKAHAAASERNQVTNEPTIFTKIINKEIPASIVHEDDKCVAFRDVNPVSPVHILVIPRKPIPMLSLADESDTELLGHLLQVAKKVAENEKLVERLSISNQQRQKCCSVGVPPTHPRYGGKAVSMATRINCVVCIELAGTF